MILQAIFFGLFNLFFAIISLVLLPFQAIITATFPNVDGAMVYVTNFLSYIADYIDLALSWTFLSTTAIQLVIVYYSFTLVIPLLIYPLKMVVQWFRSLKP